MNNTVNSSGSIASTDPANQTSAWAYYLASIGIPVLPIHFVDEAGGCSCGRADCPSTGKHPMTGHGLKDASTDPGTIGNWFAGEPDANLAIRTGAEGQIFIIDIDPRHGGEEAWAQLVSAHSELPETVTVVTGGGGRHFWFRHPGGTVRVKTHSNLVRGVDVRGDGGYALVPPSNHRLGEYTFAEGRSPGEMAVASAPGWLLDLVVGAQAPAVVVPTKDHEEAIPMGQRHPTLFSLAGALRRRGASRATIEAALRTENETRCAPPLSDAEITKMAHRVMSYPASSAASGQNHATTIREEVVAATKEAFESAADPKVVHEKVQFLVEGLVAERSITLITGKPKQAGKSTLVTALISHLLRGTPFLGLPTRTTPVVVLTEERTTYVELLKRAGLLGNGNLHFFRHDPSRSATFAEIMMAARAVATECGAKLIVVDTLAQFVGLRGDAENNPGSALEAFKPIQEAAREGFAVVVVHHENKKGGDVGDSSRGSTAFTGAADVILSVRRPEGQPSAVRVISALSRYTATPSTLYVEWTEQGYERREEAGVLGAACEKVLLERAPTCEDEAASISELIAGTGIAVSTARRAADKLVEQGKLRRRGDGKKGSPRQYWRPLDEGSNPALPQ